MAWFVYAKMNGKVFPAKWYRDHINSANMKPRDDELGVIFKKELTDKEKGMTLAQLQMTYPCPK